MWSHEESRTTPALANALVVADVRLSCQASSQQQFSCLVQADGQSTAAPSREARSGERAKQVHARVVRLMRRDATERYAFAIAKRLRASLPGARVTANEHARGYGTVDLCGSPFLERVWLNLTSDARVERVEQEEE